LHIEKSGLPLFERAVFVENGEDNIAQLARNRSDCHKVMFAFRSFFLVESMKLWVRVSAASCGKRGLEQRAAQVRRTPF